MPNSAKPFTLNLAPTAVDADGVCASQSPGAGAILINGALASGGVATFGAAQLVRLTSGGNDSGITFTFVGTDADGNVQRETVAGTSASNSDTTKFFKTVTSITASAAVATTIIVGNLITSVSPTFWPDNSINSHNLGISMQLVSGTATFALNQTYEDFKTYPVDTLWFAHATLTGLSATAAGSLLYPVSGLRIRLTASSSGVIRTQIVQAGI